MEDSIIRNLFFEDVLLYVECEYNEKKMKISSRFWKDYNVLKDYKGEEENIRRSNSEVSIEQKAMNNLNTAIRRFRDELEDIFEFLRVLKEDLLYWHTLPRYTIRRLAKVDLIPGCGENEIKEFKNEVNGIKGRIGGDYLEKIKQKFIDMEDEIVIAIENIRR
ncbi:MAG: hypothetical protein RAO94_13625 [Candidatus Stygibacter australis]|nr:hypothetical protein [Candidatus Stygibacter australis]